VRSLYEASMVTDPSRYSHEHNHDDDLEGVENVRACCGGLSMCNYFRLLNIGKHDVGTLTRKGGKHTHK